MSLNLEVFTGNLGKDAKRKDHKNGSTFWFNVAIGYGVKDRDGNWDNETVWKMVRYYVNDKRADAFEALLTSGTRVTVNGMAKMFKDDEDDQVMYTDAKDVEDTPFTKGDGSSTKKATKKSTKKKQTEEEDFDDDIPF